MMPVICVCLVSSIHPFAFAIEFVCVLRHASSRRRNELKISMVPHLKYASDEDLKQVGLSKPEIRRLRKFYEKYYPHGYLSKIKRLLQNPTKREDGMVSERLVSIFLHRIKIWRQFNGGIWDNVTDRIPPLSI